MAAVMTGAVVVALPAPSAHASEADCSDVRVPVALQEGGKKSETIYGRLCVPDGGADQVQVLLHAVHYTHKIWDIPIDRGRYSYVRAATKAGHATLALDRLGGPAGSHPLGTKVNLDSNAYAAHQVIQAIRSGEVTGPHGDRFDKVALVGNSFGGFTTWVEASRYHDVDAVVIVGTTHYLDERILPGFSAASRPMATDPKFGLLSRLDPTYLTMPSKTDKYNVYYGGQEVDPAVLQYDIDNRGSITLGEVNDVLPARFRPLDIRVPVFLTIGDKDPAFCGSLINVPPAKNVCADERTLIDAERPHLGKHVPSIDAYILRGAGHIPMTAKNAQDMYRHVQDWLTDKLGGHD